MAREHINPTDEQIQTTLEFAAIHGIRAAARRVGVSHVTVLRWIERKPELWSELRAGDREAQKHGFAQRLEDLAEGYAAVEVDALERAEKLLKSSDAKETAALIKAMGGSRATASASARAARGEDADKLEIDINFGALEKAMERVLERPAPQPVLQVANEAETVEP